MLKAAFYFVVTLVTIAYPFLVYWGVGQFNTLFFAIVIGGVALARFALSYRNRNKADWILLGLMLGLSLLVALTNSETLLRFYPVIMSGFFAGLFAMSLYMDETIIERFARAAGKVITPLSQWYMRRLTKVWVGVILLNSLIALLLSLMASLELWTLYCGLLSYVYFGLFFAGEWLFRRRFMKRHHSPNAQHSTV